VAKKKVAPTKRRKLLKGAEYVTQVTQADQRDDAYAQACRAAVKHGETDKLVRHLMAAGLAAASTADASSVLADDLTLLRWVLRKMTDNRRDAELRVIAGEVL
jgi:hypothetical protein